MRQRFNNMREVVTKQPALALKQMFWVVIIFSCVQVIVSIIVAAKNSKYDYGYKSLVFTAVWAMFLVILFAAIAGKVVFEGKAAPLLVGFLVGIAFMLCQLFFMIAVLFLGVGDEASKQQWDTGDADKAYGAFAIILCIIYFVWGLILWCHRDSVSMTEQEIKKIENEYDQSQSRRGGTEPVMSPIHDDQGEL